MFTSYYARDANHPNAYCISAWPPKWADGIACLQWLAPSHKLITQILRDEVTIEQYESLYLEEMQQKGSAEYIYSLIPDGAILLCYERPGESCHRRVLADWLTEELGVDIPELATVSSSNTIDPIDDLLTF